MAQKIQISNLCIIEKNIYLVDTEFENIECNKDIKNNSDSKSKSLYSKTFNINRLIYFLYCLIYSQFCIFLSTRGLVNKFFSNVVF